MGGKAQPSIRKPQRHRTANLARAFCQFGWCCRIRGIDRGGVVEGLPVLHHPTADGDVDRRTVTEICISETREAELASCGLIPLVHRKNTGVAAFISAQSLQRPQVFDDPDGQLSGTSTEYRVLKVADGAEIDAASVTRWLLAAVAAR